MKEFKHTIEEVDSSVKQREKILTKQLISAPQTAVTAPSGGVVIDAQSRTAINDIILKLQNLGLLE